MNLNWSNTLTNKARETEIISTNEPLVLGLSNFNNNDERQAGEAAVKLVQLIQTLPKHLSREGLISFAMHIGFSYEAANLLTSGDLRLDDKLFARADMVRDERGRWALLEMNIGTEVGGMFYASLPRLAGYSQANDVLESWAASFTKYYLLDSTKHIVIVEDPKIFTALAPQFELLAKELRQQSGCNCSIASADQLSWDGTVLRLKGKDVDYIYRFFNEQDIIEQPETYQAITSAVASGAVSIPFGIQYNLINNKGVLALLWKLANDGTLGDDNAKLVKEWIPETYWLSPADIEIFEDRRQWVIKPVNGACGRDVICGAELTEKEWADKIELFLSQPERSYVRQKFILPEIQNVTLGWGADESAKTQEKMHVIWGLYVYGNDYLGGMVRGNSVDVGYVINHATGACIGPMPQAR